MAKGYGLENSLFPFFLRLFQHAPEPGKGVVAEVRRLLFLVGRREVVGFGHFVARVLVVVAVEAEQLPVLIFKINGTVFSV